MEFTENSGINRHPCLGQRHCLMLLGLCGLTICYIMRIAPAVAIVSMVHSDTPNLTTSDVDTPYKQFNWTAMQENTILSSFFYSYLVTQLPAGWLAQRLGGKWLFATGLTLCGITTIAIPKLVESGGFIAFLLLRIFQGLCQGVCYPSIHRLCGNWFPPRENSLLSGILHSGYIIGTVIALAGSGYLIKSSGWPATFYFSGTLSLIWLPFWLWFISETPASHHSISASERRYIIQSLRSTRRSDDHQIPIRSLASNRQIWLVMFCYVLDGWANYTLLVCVPQYMDSVLHVPINENGLLSSVPYIAALAFMVIMTPIDRLIINRHCMSIPNTRKLWSGLSAFGKSLFLLIIAYLDTSHKQTIIVLLVVNVMFSSAALLGHNLADLDLAPPYAGFLFSVFNCCSTLSGILAPLAVGAFTTAYPAIIAWRNVFILSSALSFLWGLVYVVFSRQVPIASLHVSLEGSLDSCDPLL